MRNNQPINQKEYPLSSDALLVSYTGLQGNIVTKYLISIWLRSYHNFTTYRWKNHQSFHNLLQP